MKVANDTVGRSWTISKGREQGDVDWTDRQRTMFILGLDQQGAVSGMNIIGRDEPQLKNMFQEDLHRFLEAQGLPFQEFKGFASLTGTEQGEERVLSAMRSLLLLDGGQKSTDRIKQLDDDSRTRSLDQRLKDLLGEDYTLNFFRLLIKYTPCT